MGVVRPLVSPYAQVMHTSASFANARPPRSTIAVLLALFCANAAAPTSAQEIPRNSELPPARLKAESTVELHAHLFMNEGLTWLFRGDFFEELKASHWKDRFSTQTNPRELEESGNAIVVATLYAHPLTTWDMRESIRGQIAQAERFVRENPTWMLARDPQAAGRAIAEGKKVLVLALEGAAGILETEADLREFIDQRGIAIVTPLHLMDDAFGGVAFLNGFRAWASPIAYARSLWNRFSADPNDSRYHCEGVPINDQGLSVRGHELIENLLERKVWIDLSHASDTATREIRPMLKNRGQPPLYTHTVLRRYHRAERGLPEWMLPELRRESGIVGLMPSRMMLTGTPPGANDCAFACQKSSSPGEAPCEAGLASLSRQYRELSQEIGPSSVAFGSDWQGGIDHLPPTCESGTSLDSETGFWKISQTQEVWELLRRAGQRLPEPRNLMVQRFLGAWERVR